MKSYPPVSPPQSPMLAAAIDAVYAACQVTRRVQRDSGAILHQIKADRSPVTVADLAAQAVIVQKLSAALGPIELAGEEDASSLRASENTTLREAVYQAALPVWPDATIDDVLDAIDQGNHAANSDGYWTLDPIDGTKGFLRGKHYAIALARIEDGKVTLGVLGCPNLSLPFEPDVDGLGADGLIFYAARGEGAYALSAGANAGAARRLCELTPFSNTSLRVCESREPQHSRRDTATQILAALNIPKTSVAIDSQCKYAVVAGGEADLYMRIPTEYHPVEYIWDHAAGCIIATESGAVVSDLAGRPLDFAHGTRLERNHGIICARPGLHEQVIAAISKLGIV